MKKNLGVFTLSVLVLFSTVVGVSFAQEGETGYGEIGRAVAPMTLDCNSLTEQQIKEAHALGMCLPSRQGDAIPRSTVQGNCGSATLIINDSFLDSTTAFFLTNLNSTRGAMVGGSLNVTYSGPSSGSFSPGTPIFQNQWSNSTNRSTGAGRVNATFSGWVGIASTTLVCTVGPVNASGTVQ